MSLRGRRRGCCPEGVQFGVRLSGTVSLRGADAVLGAEASTEVGDEAEDRVVDQLHTGHVHVHVAVRHVTEEPDLRVTPPPPRRPRSPTLGIGGS
jgi:hypothetical protein